MITIDDVLAFVGKAAVYGGSAAAFAYWVFKQLGSKWIESKFAQRLEQLRHGQAMELQRLRVEIDSMLSASIKLQEKEFEALPQAWALLDEAYRQLSALTSPLQQYPDLDRYTHVQLEEFFASRQLVESQRDEIRGSNRKADTFKEIIFWKKLGGVQGAIGDLHNYVERNGIFMPPELKELFETVSNELWSAAVSKEVGHTAKDWKMQTEGWDKVKDVVGPMKKNIGDFIYSRLQKHGRKENAASA